MRLKDELNKLGINYYSEIINGSEFITCKKGTRIHITKDSVYVCAKEKCYSMPPKVDSLNYVLGIVKQYEC